ncbi:hypothetical protein BD770DRAFT_381921 [Pilaira anomala]|nr:hypothetical protein BD770DRAFT_381921 [Pilaira anomala]
MSRTRPETPELTLQYATDDPDSDYTIIIRKAGFWPRKSGRERERDEEPLKMQTYQDFYLRGKRGCIYTKIKEWKKVWFFDSRSDFEFHEYSDGALRYWDINY